MQGTRSSDNCYLWTPNVASNVTTSRCMLSQADETKLWHKKLGHLNLRSMNNLLSKQAITGIPDLKIEEGKICGECQIGKQTRMSHKPVQHLTTSRVLELLHVDLMGPMQTESLGGKRYVFVCVDDFSRYTWVDFLREKSDTFAAFEALCNKVRREKGRKNWKNCQTQK